MSILTNKDLHTPFNNTTRTKLASHIKAVGQEQTPASSATVLIPGLLPTTQDLYVTDLYAVSDVTVAAGESVTYDIQIKVPGGAFATILSTLLTLPAGNVAGVQAKGAVLSSTKIPAGSLVEVIRVYTPGGGPALGANHYNKVVLELGVQPV